MSRLLFALLALSACSSGPREEFSAPTLPQRAGTDPIVAARAEGVELRARGEGFTLDIFRADTIRLTLSDTGEVLIFPKPEPRLPRWNGSIFETATETHRLVIEIRDDRPCTSGDRANFPTGVNVSLSGRDFSGCGRRL